MSERAAAQLLERLVELSADLRGAAVLDAAGSMLASVGCEGAGKEAWEEAAGELWRAAEEGGGGGEATHVHVGTEEGEVFAVRDGSASVVAAADRFALASLMLCDLRAVLRDLRAEPVAEDG